MSDGEPLPGFVAKLTGYPLKSKTDDGAVLELMDAFGLLPSPNAATRDYDAEAAAMSRSGPSDDASDQTAPLHGKGQR